MERRKLAAGNWKMNGLGADLSEIRTLIATHPTPKSEILICPPATLLRQMSDLVTIGGQDCHAAPSGAHTGDISAAMLCDAGAQYVILGHSERRADHGETNDDVRAKAKAAHAEGLTSIICVGETLAERESGQTLTVVGAQLSGSVPDAATQSTLVVAYEPVWAIGTGKVPTLEQIAEVHQFIRAELTSRFGADAASGMRILYGGSVKAANANDIFAVKDVDGALVGGASLKAADFGPIVEALDASG